MKKRIKLHYDGKNFWAIYQERWCWVWWDVLSIKGDSATYAIGSADFLYEEGTPIIRTRGWDKYVGN